MEKIIFKQGLHWIIELGLYFCRLWRKYYSIRLKTTILIVQFSSFAEKGILVNFTLLAVLWLSRDPGFAPGWATLFADG